MLDEAVSVEVIRHFCHIATHRLGVGLGDGHQALVAGRVAKRLRALQVDVDEYIERLNEDEDCSEVIDFLDFLRPRPPRFFARRQDHNTLHTALVAWLGQGKRRIRLWSAGCGSGEEAYGMALTTLGAMEVAKVGLQEVDVKILATDMSKAVLQRGKQGLYDDEQLRDVPRTLYDRYFHATDNGLAIDEDVKDLVRFRRLNLTKLPYPMTGPLEAIFCHEGLQPLVRSARTRVTNAVKELITEEGLLCTGFDDEAVAAARLDQDVEEDALVSLTGRIRPGHC
jgi:chemotaxis protein methyltransferase CheR